MNISALFIRRPVTTTLVMLGILIFGIMGYKSLPVSDLPTVDFPTITVNANLPGASAETMASGVATPLEKNFSTIADLDSMSSTSSLERTQITLQFSLSRNVDTAAHLDGKQHRADRYYRLAKIRGPDPAGSQSVNHPAGRHRRRDERDSTRQCRPARGNLECSHPCLHFGFGCPAHERGSLSPDGRHLSQRRAGAHPGSRQSSG